MDLVDGCTPNRRVDAKPQFCESDMANHIIIVNDTTNNLD